MKLVTNKVRQFVSKKKWWSCGSFHRLKLSFDIRLLDCSLKYQLICISACVDNWNVLQGPRVWVYLEFVVSEKRTTNTDNLFISATQTVVYTLQR